MLPALPRLNFSRGILISAAPILHPLEVLANFFVIVVWGEIHCYWCLGFAFRTISSLHPSGQLGWEAKIPRNSSDVARQLCLVAPRRRVIECNHQDLSSISQCNHFTRPGPARTLNTPLPCLLNFITFTVSAGV